MVVRAAFLFLVFLLSSAVLAKTVPSKVDAVTVYPGGATVTRTAAVSLSAGSNSIQLIGLLNSIDAESLRVEVGGDGVRIGQVNLETTQQRETNDTEIAALQLDIDAVTDRIGTIADSSAAAKLQLTFLQGIATGYSKDAGNDGVHGAADVASWRAALALLLSASEDASKLIRANEAKSKELAKDLSVLQRQMNDLRGGGLSSTVVELVLHSGRAVQTDIRLRYFVEDAYWQPRYEARLDSNSGDLRLAQQADVYQQTDEDWSNVRLTLSTSHPGGELTAPELNSEFLSLYRPQRQRAVARRLTSVAPAAAETDMNEIVVAGHKVQADVGGFAVNYDIPGRTNVSNDNDDGVIIDLASFSFVADLVTQVVPRQSTQAFLTARFVYDKALPLYGSEMMVFVDGAFAGYSAMPTALPQAEVVLPMGQDRRIAVTAETQGGEGGRGGIISKRQTETTDYLFELSNRRSTPSAVEVVDLYPIARDKDIDVEIPDSATPPDERDVDDKPGVILWKKTLGPGESWRIRHQYSVSYPAKAVLTTE